VLNCEGKAFGFIFSDNTRLLSVLRHTIDDQVTYFYTLLLVILVFVIKEVSCTSLSGAHKEKIICH